MSIKDLPKHLRPREKLYDQGPENLKTKELLAILFRTGRAGKSAIELSKDLLKKHPLTDFNHLDYEAVQKIKGLDQGKVCSLLAAVELGKRIHHSFNTTLPSIENPDDALAHLHFIRQYKREYFVVLFLNARNQLVNSEVISIGTVNASMVHPREVFAPALEHRASALILAHNHPSNNPEPSPEDISLTERLIEAGSVLAIEVLDHLIVCKNSHASLKELQLL